jgi:hypothetical protein
LGLALRSYREALAQCDRADASAAPAALRCRLSLALCMLKRGDARGTVGECTTLLEARRPQASPTVQSAREPRPPTHTHPVQP